ncbi:MAG: hypothetical protein U1F24_03965 [Alphaproteobacteria bacterium]
MPLTRRPWWPGKARSDQVFGGELDLVGLFLHAGICAFISRSLPDEARAGDGEAAHRSKASALLAVSVVNDR